MATYKVLQDIEAEDKLLWQLSFRQFVYALIAFFMLYLSYIFYSKGVGFLLLVTVPVMGFTGFLAFPFGKDQPTEVWALARLRFLFKPRKRIWAQSGVKELVTITVPKKIEIDRTDGLTETEVRSRLQALANTIDSRGWAIKNVSGVYANPIVSSSNDRLINDMSLPQNVPEYVVADSEDILDVKSNPLAHQMDQLLSAKNSLHRQQLIETLSKIRSEENKESEAIPQNVVSTPPSASQIAATTIPIPTDDKQITNELKELNTTQHMPLNNMRTLSVNSNMVADQSAPTTNQTVAEPTAPPASTRQSDPVILNLANRNDLNVTVIAHEANKAKTPKTGSEGEVLISLR
jgi:hypothetical protein